MYTLGISKISFKRIRVLQTLFFIPKEITINCTDTTLAEAYLVCWGGRILSWKSSTQYYGTECEISLEATDKVYV